MRPLNIEPYSPPVRHDYPENVYWGDTHLHTYLSADDGAVTYNPALVALLGHYSTVTL